MTAPKLVVGACVATTVAEALARHADDAGQTVDAHVSGLLTEMASQPMSRFLEQSMGALVDAVESRRERRLLSAVVTAETSSALLLVEKATDSTVDEIAAALLERWYRQQPPILEALRVRTPITAKNVALLERLASCGAEG